MAKEKLKCPSCRVRISEKSKRCFNCGFYLVPMHMQRKATAIRYTKQATLINCPECKFQVPANNQQCINCNTQLYNAFSEEELRKKERWFKFRKKLKRILLLIIIAVILATLICFIAPYFTENILPTIKK